MKEIVLDFTKCKNAKNTDELYQVIKEKIPYHFDYGNNPNALWDIMRDYWNKNENICFSIFGVNELNYPYLQDEMKYILEVFEDVHSENPNIMFEVIS